MIRKKLLPIDDCENCTHIYYGEFDPYCDKEHMVIGWDGDAVPIPEWCELDDAGKGKSCISPKQQNITSYRLLVKI